MGSFVDLQELGATVVISGEIDDPAMRHFNPSLAHDEFGDIRIAIRSCNFAVERGGKWYFRDGSSYSKTDVLYGYLDDNLQVVNLKKLKLSDNTPTNTKLAGLEDVRLFLRKDGMHAIGFESDRLTRSLHNASATMAEYLIKDDELVYLRTLEKPDIKRVEKNWQPTDLPTNLFEFTYSPTERWKNGKVVGIEYKGDVHGGSQLIDCSDGTYLSLVHEKRLEPTYAVPYSRYRPNVYDKYVYVTYLARHDKNGVITEMSKPFRFGTLENIEFASGMVAHKGDFLISLGIRDCKYAIVRIPQEKLLSLMDNKETE